VPPRRIELFVAGVVVLAAIVTIGPAWHMARLRPGEALRAE
jgi:ABC-type lipoprotein release transport system permease subunit